MYELATVKDMLSPCHLNSQHHVDSLHLPNFLATKFWLARPGSPGVLYYNSFIFTTSTPSPLHLAVKCNPRTL